MGWKIHNMGRGIISMSNKKLTGAVVVWPSVRVPVAFDRIVKRIQRESGFHGQLLTRGQALGLLAREIACQNAALAAQQGRGK